MLKLIRMNIRRIIKTPQLVGMLFALPMTTLIILMFVMTVDKESPSVTTGIALGAGNARIEETLKSDDVEFAPESGLEGLLKRMDRGELRYVYEIPADFLAERARGEKVSVKAYSMTGKMSDPAVDVKLQTMTETAVRKELWKERGLSEEAIVPAQRPVELSFAGEKANELFMVASGMLCAFLLMNGPALAGDMLELRKTRALKRMASAPIGSRTLLLSLFVSYAVFLILSAAIPMAGIGLVQGFGGLSLPLVVSYYAAMVFFSLSFGMILFRFVSDMTVASILGMGIAIAFLLLGLLPELGVIPKSLEFIGGLSPIYWVFNGIDTHAFFPGVPAIFLLGAILFTAGSFRLEDYAMK